MASTVIRRTAADRAKNVADRRFALFMALGAMCVLCGEDDLDELQFDHPFGRDYQPRDLSRWVRICRLEHEAKQGLIRVLCEDCNKRAGKPPSPFDYDDQTETPL